MIVIETKIILFIVKLWFYEDIKKETSRNGFGEGSKAS